ncbi:hypothetical protein UAY_01142 [Enterococcus moraviensis ATCC BAA-383]|uniref:DUF2975 domain-containing protein n=2 Tax=Enterococcus moraviensis TaxID=155617 RepID=R2T9K0_9ENTE|nr:hypothetical protein UAY_01142 [Enterococcus moraviensis ATCC BAA-383]EOT73731.1 hypothetical protein I586_00725 [Enterococcus moraviensis ATCC BAA-383]
MVNDIFLSIIDKNLLTFKNNSLMLDLSKKGGVTKMEWTEKKSVKLSHWCIYIVGGMLLLTMIFMPKVIEMIVPLDAVSLKNQHWFMITLESCLAVGLVILFLLQRLIKNIDNNETFSERNIEILRLASWLCFLEALILLLSASYYFPWIVLAGVAGFVGLVVRVIKNVFCQALLIKTENDFTI